MKMSRYIYTVTYFDGNETQKEKGYIHAPNHHQAYCLVAQEFTTHFTIDIKEVA